MSQERLNLASQLSDLTRNVKTVQEEVQSRWMASLERRRKRNEARKLAPLPLNRSISTASIGSSVDWSPEELSSDESDGAANTRPSPLLAPFNGKPLPRRVGHVRSGSLGSERIFGTRSLVMAKSESVECLADMSPRNTRKVLNIVDFKEVRRSSATGQIEPYAYMRPSGSCLNISQKGKSLSSLRLSRTPTVERKRLLSISTAV